MNQQIHARYRVSSRSTIESDKSKTYVGRVHYYEPFAMQWPGQRHLSEYKRALYSESSGIKRLNPADAQMDAVLMGRGLTGHKWPDNNFASNRPRILRYGKVVKVDDSPTHAVAKKHFNKSTKPLLDDWSRSQYKEHGEHWCTTSDGNGTRPLVCAGIRLSDGKMRAPIEFYIDDYGNTVSRIVTQ